MSRMSFAVPNHVHFLTFSTYQRRPLFNDTRLKRLFVESLEAAREKETFLLFAWALMPEHVHLLIYPLGDSYSVGRILRAIKETFSRRTISYWQHHDPALLKRHTIREGKRILHRIWLPGGGYDRNLVKIESIRRAIEYIEQNPVRRKLVSNPSDWRWSSASISPVLLPDSLEVILP